MLKDENFANTLDYWSYIDECQAELGKWGGEGMGEGETVLSLCSVTAVYSSMHCTLKYQGG